ncbi:hypothetical protein BC629DRAFT_1589969 [Irpex lacteus]|nr:hypothetical protein BC629DRAFT_1589969 [Irpex lacteus]
MPRDSSKIYRFSAVYKITSPVTNIIIPAPPPWHTERARQVVVPAQDEFPLQGEQGDIEQAERHYEHPVPDPSDLPVRPRASRDSTPDSDAEVDALLQVPTLTAKAQNLVPLG